MLEEDQGGTLQGYRPGPGLPGWVRTYRGAAAVTHPLQPLLGASGARFAGNCLRFAACSVGGYYPSPTHPAIPVHGTTRPAPPFCASCTAGHGVAGTCTYGSFRHLVGEPRGSRTHPVFSLQDPYLTVIWVLEALHGRLTGFRTCFTEFWTEFRTCLTEFSTCLTEFSTFLTEFSTCFTEL